MGKFPFLFSLFVVASMVFGKEEAERNDSFNGRIGVIVDKSCRIGKEESLAMQMAIEDFNFFNNQNFSLSIRDSKSDPNLAALAAKDLISMQKVQVLIGPQTWEEASHVAEVGSKNHIPVLSLADEMPKWATERLGFLVQASPNKFNQMKAIASIIGSWDWHLVKVIYEDRDFTSSGIFPDLVHAVKDFGAEISDFVALPYFDSDLLSNELERLRRGSSRVFVVHMSFQGALRLFEKAKEMGMMEKGYVWITTDSFTSLAHSFNVSINSLLQGVIGVKSYFPEEDRFHDFYHRFCKRFRSEYAEEDNHEPGIFAVHAYDAVRTAALAMSEVQKQGHPLLEKIKLIDFQGLSGHIHFKDGKLPPANTFQIINVNGRSYRELGFWSDDLGFSKNFGESALSHSSMKIFDQVFWPGGFSGTPRGWDVPTDAKALRIGVPTHSMFKQYTNVEEDPLGNKSTFNGFAIDLFKETLKYLPFYLPYRFYPFNGSYDDLVKQIHLKNFDAAVGPIAIDARRYQYAEFTHPYSEAGLVMIVRSTENKINKAWLFTKPFTTTLWALIAVINIYNGFVVWLIERNHCPEHEGSMFNQAGNLLCSSFTTFFSLHGNGLHSNLSRMTMVVWLFMALVITQIYTANLSSMLTVKKLEPTISNIETLKSVNAIVGYSRGSFVRRYLEGVLDFHAENIKNYSTPDEYAEALKSREIEAVFLEAPYAKLFLARFCNGFMISGPTYKIGGFGLAFPRGSLLLPYVNEAMLNATEDGKFRFLENNMIACEKCVDGEPEDGSSSISPTSFFLLFVLSGGVSTIALTLYIIHTHKSSFHQNTIWTLIVIVILKRWRNHRSLFSRRVIDVPQTATNNSPHATNLQIQV